MQLRLIILLLVVFSAPAQSEPVTELPWSFNALKSTPLPETKQSDWPQTRLDHFILSRIESTGLEPASPASERVLLRRIYFDLIGLPPTPKQLAVFREHASRNRADAIRDVVDELLASPHYGERWARHWLDLARYTDKTASWLNSTASAWRYRDWIVQAFNRDLPYNVFVKQQLANDLMTGSDPEDNAALGYLGLSPTYWKELQLPPEVIKTTVADEWEERMDAVGRTFLGLTLACARCHDHKFEPVTQADYYAIAGVFASVRISDRPTISDEMWAPVAKARTEVAGFEKEIASLKKKKQDTKLPNNEVTDVTRKMATLESQIAKIVQATAHYHTPMVNGVSETALFVKPADGKHGTNLDYQNGQSRNLPIHKRGNPNATGEIIQRRFLGAFPISADSPRRFEQGSGRLDLAKAIVEEAAPLSARVIVNRVWQHHFGRGLVATPSELGHSGEPPSHPALIDDLTMRFIENAWSLKWLHREILMSATWQQSVQNAASQEADPNNDLLARANRRRLDAETWRDSVLAVSQQLDRTVGGAPEDLEAPDHSRRTLYGMIHRREPNPFLRTHDFPDPTAHSPSREQTITPLQQLFSLNSPFIRSQSEALARVLRNKNDNAVPFNFVYQHLFQRSPRTSEIRLANQFLEGSEHDLEAWTQYAQALLVGNEFLFID
ncbi:DUF1549 and DUF1553 domain-containing protein [bacterium]|jgi:hypothetical protein|nr:DUF1549 and DUF1553 domain-containing protein [bacterium]